ncbi:MAG: hypothetical protein E5X80_19700 [Mesorhizobium sp.]|nr:MAG: hypothetical protein EOR71_26485 [Mesorhizobium sp.]TIO50172.1 MAG: hypothetical protein E5X78_22950 [Mesorhizobium sp.]TIO57309.1 MAG: hypothetical protein E5X79_26870 [Mesorhizobium sp.]TJV61847.1 MAG: hypothetical protein E5X80_19700 [Mesorhizobium sp.]
MLKDSKLVASIVLLLTVAGCSQTTGSISTSSTPQTSGPHCHRSVPLGKFDPNCDEPRLGFKNFSPPPIVTGFQMQTYH